MVVLPLYQRQHRALATIEHIIIGPLMRSMASLNGLC